MCGILVDFDRACGHRDERLRAGLEVLRPRGPDDLRHTARGPVWMGHTRLAMNRAGVGAQPMEMPEHGLLWVVNGELYNADRVERSLMAEGLPVPEGSDARVVGPLYLRYGLDFVEHLSGEWAVVLWDAHRSRLVAARDPFGVRPLFVARTPRGVRLASSAEALLATGWTARWDRSALEAVFQHQYLLPGQTIFAGIRSLLPGGMGLLNDSDWTVRRWWSLPLPEPGPPVEPAELRHTLAGAVERRLQADVSLGVQLSGGVDSASVAALAGRMRPGLTAWTVAFVDHPGWNEERFAREVARASGLDHRVVQMSQADLLEDVVASVVAGGAPVINLHGAARYRLARACREAGVLGLLTGEGADELWFGYAHLRHDHARLCPQGVRADRDEPVAAGVHLPVGDALDTSSIHAQLGFLPTFLAAKAALAVRFREVLADPMRWPDRFDDLLHELAAGSLELTRATESSASASPVQQSAWLWTHLCLSGSILAVLCDPQELAHGVEGRLPFLDLDMVRLAMRVSDHDKLRGGLEKAVLRDAMAGLVPDSVRLRPKQPFMAPPLVGTAGLTRLWDDLAVPAFLSRDALQAALAPAADPSMPASARDPVVCLALSLSILHSVHAMAEPA